MGCNMGGTVEERQNTQQIAALSTEWGLLETEPFFVACANPPSVLFLLTLECDKETDPRN